jgi:fatty-acyl-CoA synthase
MYPGKHAAETPHKVAATLADTGESITYGELEGNSVRLAHVLHDAGLRRGDAVALLTDNNLRAFEVYWAAMRSGLYITVVNHNLAPDEVSYIVNDSGARALVVSAAKAELAASVEHAGEPPLKLAFGGSVAGYASYEDALAAASDEPFADQPRGMTMLYSSGTTGRPKGVRPPLPEDQLPDGANMLAMIMSQMFAVGPDTVYLSPAPLYHAAPLGWSCGVQALGGTVVLLKKFDARACLAAIETYRVTHAQFVPTMFVRMLQLPEQERADRDLSSLRLAIHAAAPCPVEVKQKMIDWWGPILVEYYAGTEANGMTMIDSATWLTRPGTVGRPILGVLRICDDETGDELPAGEVGTVYWERETMPFSYHNDPEKTASAQHPKHPNWSTLGDVGYVDEDGFLFLTDRRSFMIISGGVNIYPQETENVLALHPAVHDVAVIGVPDPEMGESVKAFVQPAPGVETGPELEQEIIAFVKSRIAGYKAPRSVQFVDDLPRTETGKLVKGELKKRYVQA